MNNEEQFETIEIPDVLLELQGLRTAEVRLTDDEFDEAVRLERLGETLNDSRIVEAGLKDFVKLWLGRGTSVEEIEQLLNKVRGLNSTMNAGMPDAEKYTAQMADFLENMKRGTGKRFFYGPYNRNMAQHWQQIQELAQRAEAGDSAAYLSLQQALGEAGVSSESSLGKYWLSNALRFMKKDEKWLSQKMPGVHKIGDGGIPKDITIKEFFESAGALQHGGAAAPGTGTGNVIIHDPAAVSTKLKQMSDNVALSAGVRGFSQSLGTMGALAVKGVPAAAGVGATLWGVNQGMHMPVSKDELSNVGKYTSQGGELSVNPNGRPDDGSKSNGLGGTTNGNNIGGLGGQFSPKSTGQDKEEPNQGGWAPQAPNLPNNKRDWLPTNTSDYYDLIKKSESESHGVRFAANPMQERMQQFANFENVDTVARNVFTILEQGVPGEETFQKALKYIEEEGAKANTFLQHYNNQTAQTNGQQVQSPQNEKVE